MHAEHLDFYSQARELDSIAAAERLIAQSKEQKLPLYVCSYNGERFYHYISPDGKNVMFHLMKFLNSVNTSYVCVGNVRNKGRQLAVIDNLAMNYDEFLQSLRHIGKYADFDMDERSRVFMRIHKDQPGVLK